MNAKLARGAAIATAIAAGAIIAMVERNREPEGLSEVIVEQWQRIEGAPWLKANLSEALVYLPDRPHSRAEVEAQREGRSSSLERLRSYTVSTGEMRLRGGDPGAKTEGTLRAIALGDSVTHGWGVAEEESYPNRLEQLLQGASIPMEVVNAGVPANRVSIMRLWCERVAPELDPDWILWTRRPDHREPNPVDAFVRSVESCRRATGAEVMVVLPPISTFDLFGQEVMEEENEALRRRFGDEMVILDLTGPFREAQRGHGEWLERDGDEIRVVDQESGKELFRGSRPPHDLPLEIYELFESDEEVKEHLFFDEGHPDAEGFQLFADEVFRELGSRLER